MKNTNKKTILASAAAALVIAITGLAVFAGCSSAKAPETTTQVASVTANEAINTAVNESSLTSAEAALENAKSIALKAANVKAEDAVFVKAYLDTENGRNEYDIEFTAGGYEYDYEIDAATGRITESNKELEDGPAPSRTPSKKAETTLTVRQTPAGGVGLDAAKAAALQHAKVDAAYAVFTKAVLDNDRDDFIATYEIEFTAGGYEYDYDIIASTGKIAEFDKERVYVAPTTAKDTSAYIDLAAAKSAALADAGVKAADATFTKAVLDNDADDIIATYDIEFVSGNFEYEYEINAASGKIIEKDREIAGR